MDDRGKSAVETWLADVSAAAEAQRDATRSFGAVLRMLDDAERKTGRRDALEGAEGRLDAALAQLEESWKVSEFTMAVMDLPDSRLAKALIVRVIDGMSWPACAEAVHLSRSQLGRIKSKLMPDIESIVPARYRKGVV